MCGEGESVVGVLIWSCLVWVDGVGESYNVGCGVCDLCLRL